MQNDLSGPNDLVKAVDKLLNDIGPKFERVSKEMFAKRVFNDFSPLALPKLTFSVDEMGKRLDDMEAAINANNDTGVNHGSE